MGARAEVITFAGGGADWQVATRAPNVPNVARHIREYVGYRERGVGPSSRREVSGARVVLIVELGPPIRVDGQRHAAGFIAGLSDRFTLTTHEGVQEGVQIDLAPVAARLFCHTPLTEIAGRSLSLDELWPEAPETIERMREVPSWDARFDLLDAALARRWAEPGVPARVTAWACAAIEQAGGAVSVRALAKETGYSEKHVTRLFRDHVGVGPKRYARGVRFDRLLRAAQAQPARSWAELAYDFGFSDQAHLAREVRDLSGMTPTELRASRDEVAAMFAS